MKQSQLADRCRALQKRLAELRVKPATPFHFPQARPDLLTTRPKNRPSSQYWLLAFFLLILFATGGASRTDVQSLIILRPMSIIVCALACMTLNRGHFAGRAWLLGWAGAIFLLALLHLAPLPPSIWASLAGRQDLVDVEELAGLSGIWRPLTLAPMNGWHALLSLFAPLAVLLLGIQLNRDDLFRLLPLVIALAALSGLLGLLQVIGDPQGSLYFYRITNNGSAVGLFANRNHAATLLACLFPMLAVYAATARGEADTVGMRQLMAAAIAIVLVPLILVTGSRSGLVSTVIGLSTAAILYRQPTEVRTVRRGKPDRVKALPVLGGIALISLAFLTYFLSRAEAIERLFMQASGKESRADFWTVSIDLFWKYFPWGSGSGSFAEAYQIIEPARLLDATYLNRAHNDWVETAVTFGLPGAVALSVAVITFGLRCSRLWRSTDGSERTVAYGRLASVMIAMIAIASASDYPLRTPTMMGLFAIFTLWLTEAGRNRAAARAVSSREA
jgi:O-antigen ligase